MRINEIDLRWYQENVLPMFEGFETIMEPELTERVLELTDVEGEAS